MKVIYDTPLPDGWSEEPLAKVVVTRRGYTWEKADEVDRAEPDTVPVIRIPNVQHTLDLTDLIHLRNVSPEALEKAAVTKDWLLFVGSNGTQDRIGDSVLIEEDRPMVFASFLMGIQPKDQTCLRSDFFAHWMRLHLVHEIFSKTSQQTTGLANFSWGAVKKLPVRFPSCVDEQRRIAASLKLADYAILKARAELDATRELKKSLLNELLEKGLPGRHSSFIETKRLCYPESWTLTKLKKCGTWSAGGTPDRENISYYEGSIPWVKSGEVNYSVIFETEEHLSEDGAKQTTCGVLPVGTLLIAMYGAGVTRGRVALLGIPASTNQAVSAFNGHDGVENEFIYYWFERNYERVRAWAAGSNQDNLSGHLLKNLQIAIPDHDEQIEIVKLLKAADGATCTIQKTVDALMELKRSLLQNLLTGKIRIPEGAIHA